MAKILLVDDSESVRSALSTLLQHAGHEVTEAADGKQALGALEQDQFDLVVTDIFMPTMDGIELIKQLRGAHPELKILALSGGGARQPAKYAMGLASSLGADAALQKPVDNAGFLAEIEALTRPKS